MELIVLVGIPGSGKSTIARERFPRHKRISLDALRTRKREDTEIAKCLQNGEDIIVDNTNTTIKSRRKYIEAASVFGIPVRAVYLNTPIEVALQRNALREGRELIPDRAVRMYYRMLEPPTTREGFESVEEIRPELANATHR
jgi:predicted kinase